MKCIFFAILVSCIITASGQKEFKVGDKIPDFKIQIVNRKNKTSLSSFYKGKSLLIDFWGYRCVPCVAELPKLDSLRKIFKNKLEIIAVNEEILTVEKNTPRKVINFINSHASLRNLKLPFAIDDGALKKYFAHNQLPSEIWIDRFGRVRAKTDGESVNYENIKRFVNKGIAPEYTREMIDIDYLHGPFISGDTGFICRSILERANLNVPDHWVIGDVDSNNTKAIKRVYYSGATIKDLFFTAAFGYSIPRGQKGRYVLNVKDSLSYVSPEEAAESYKRSNYKTKTEWELEHTFIYEIILPKPVPVNVFLNDYMLDDLNRYFDVKGTIEMREMPCYVIINKTDASREMKSQMGEPTWKMDSVSNGRIRPFITGIQNKNLNEIADKLSSESYGLPFANGTDNTEPIDIICSPAIPAYTNRFNLNALRETFNKYGFDIVEEKKRIKVIVITGKDR